VVVSPFLLFFASNSSTIDQDEILTAELKSQNIMGGLRIGELGMNIGNL